MAWYRYACTVLPIRQDQNVLTIMCLRVFNANLAVLFQPRLLAAYGVSEHLICYAHVRICI